MPDEKKLDGQEIKAILPPDQPFISLDSRPEHYEKSPLKKELESLDQKAQEQLQKLQFVWENRSVPPEQPVPLSQFDTVLFDINEYVRNPLYKHYEPDELLSSTSVIYGKAENLIQQITGHAQSLHVQENIASLDQEIKMTREHRNRLEEGNILQRVRNIFSVQRLDDRITQLYKNKSSLEAQALDLDMKKTTLTTSLEKLRAIQEENMVILSTVTLSKMIDEYGEFTKRITKPGGDILREVGNVFLDNYVKPEIETAVGQGIMSREEAYMLYREVEQLAVNQSQQDMAFTLPSNYLLYGRKSPNGQSYLNPRTIVSLGHSSEFLEGFIEEHAVRMLTPLRDYIAEFDFPYDKKSEILHRERESARAESGWSEDPVIKSVRNLLLTGVTSERIYFYLELFQYVKQSPLVVELFGPEATRLNSEFYQKALSASLGDSSNSYLESIIYTQSTPEILRNIILLATANSSGDSSIMANNILTKFARDNVYWSRYVDELIAAYPQLSVAKKTLLTFNTHGTQRVNDKLFEQIQPYVLSLVDSPQLDEKVKSLAIQSLSNEHLISRAKQRGLITEEERNMIDFTQKRLDELQKKTNAFSLLGDYDPRVFGAYIYQAFRESLQQIEQKPEDGDLTTFHNLLALTRKIYEEASKEKPNLYFLDIMSSSRYVDYVKKTSPENITQVLSVYDLYPIEVIRNRKLMDFLTYQLNTQAIEPSSLSQFPTRFKGIMNTAEFFELCRFPTICLKQGDEAFSIGLVEKYSNRPTLLNNVLLLASKRGFSRRFIETFPNKAAGLLGDSKDGEPPIITYIFQNQDILLEDESDIDFLNSFAGLFGAKADVMIRGYKDCLEQKALTRNDKEVVIEFTRKFKVLNPGIIREYLIAKKLGQEEVLIADLKAMSSKMTGAGTITEEERKKPAYKALIQHVYPNNSGGNWTDYERNNNCQDRQTDLAGFTLQPRYEIDLLSESDVHLQEDQKLNTGVIDVRKKQIMDVAQNFEAIGYNMEQALLELDKKLDQYLLILSDKKIIPEIAFTAAKTREEKFFLLLCDSIYGQKAIDVGEIKSALLSYEFAAYEDVRQYIQGTSDRVSRARNPDYALLCELHTFYADRIKEINRRIVQAGYENPQLAPLMADYFHKITTETQTAQEKQRLASLQPEKLGLSEGFIRQIQKAVEQRTGKKHTPEQIRRLVHLYESMTSGLLAEKSTSTNPKTQAVFGQLKAQRNKTLAAVKAITGQELEPEFIHLGEIDLQQMLAAQTMIQQGQYDADKFSAYTTQQFIDVFNEEKASIEGELTKFVSETGKTREVLNGYISKTKETANARMVGGVCVAGDNPPAKENMWDSPNYFQLVLQDPNSFQCQGLVLLHHFVQDGKKILTASYNPSSTYLYTVDPEALFIGMTKVLEQFAIDNNFDLIAISNNKTIRTNRTGGEFEKAIDRRVATVSKSFDFTTAQVFSNKPQYRLQKMDVIWEKP